MLITRILTALILLPLAISAIYFLTPLEFLFVDALIVGWASFEWAGFVFSKSMPKQIYYVIGTEFIFVIAHFVHTHWFMLIATVFWAMTVFWIIVYPKSENKWAQGYWPRIIMGWLTLIPFGLALYAIRFDNLFFFNISGANILLLILVLIWANDTGAYFVGKYFGKTKLAPAISPGKTMQGLWGGLGLTLLVMLLIALILHLRLAQIIFALIIALLVGLVGTVGDLYESMQKRVAGVKDSGRLLPGHGGILDRIDSVTAVLPVVTFILSMKLGATI